MRISQIILEPILRAAIDASPLIDARFGWKFDGLLQSSDSVRVRIRNSESDVLEHLTCSYLAGCDGGGSRVRRELNIKLEGQQNIARLYMIHFKSKDRPRLNPWGIAWHLQCAAGNLVAQDDQDTWTVHLPLPLGADELTLDPNQVLRKFFGTDFQFEILVANAWSPNQVIAERYLDGRVLLAGDAAHQVIPTGGYGMNTGVGDAVDLGWKLAAVINQWGGSRLPSSYETERRPIAVQNRAAAERHFGVRIAIADAFAAAAIDGPLDEAGTAGQLRRVKLGARIAELGNAENESWGIEHGYRYVASEVIVPDEETAPPFDPLFCFPTTIPGGRLPHIVLNDGTSLIDHLGEEFTLLVIGDNTPTVEFQTVAATLGMPLAIVVLADEPCLAKLERRLLLVRPDQHIAWRGQEPPLDVNALLSLVTGRSARNEDHMQMTRSGMH
jgi:2-polyprenyl-6-methoxyphenol hydroxylase-like FAD-dependent oxidoreductase